MVDGVDLGSKKSSYGTVLEHRGKRLLGQTVAGLDLNSMINDQKKAILETKKPFEEKLETHNNSIAAIDELRTKYFSVKSAIDSLTSNPRDAEGKTRTSIFSQRVANLTSTGGMSAEQINTFLQVTPGPNASGTFSLKVDQAASYDFRISRTIADPTVAMGITDTLTINGFDVNITPTDHLNMIANKINQISASTNVRAHVFMVDEMTGEHRLELISTELASPINLNDGGGGFLSAIQDGLDDLSIPTNLPDLQARFEYNGVSIVQNTNTFERDGTSIIIKADHGDTFNITFARDNVGILQAINNVVEKFNEFSDFVTEQTAGETVQENGHPVYKAKEGADLFKVDFVKTLMSELRQNITLPVDGLASDDFHMIGTMSPGQNNDIGLLFKFDSQEGSSRFEIDPDKLYQTILNNPEKLEKLFSLKTTSNDPNFRVWNVPKKIESVLAQNPLTVTFSRDAGGILTGQFILNGIPYNIPTEEMQEGVIKGLKDTILDGLIVVNDEAANLANGASVSGIINLTQGVAHRLEKLMDTKLDPNSLQTTELKNRPAQKVDYFGYEQEKLIREKFDLESKIKKIDDDADKRVDQMLKSFEGVYAAQAQFEQTTKMLDALKSATSN